MPNFASNRLAFLLLILFSLSYSQAQNYSSKYYCQGCCSGVVVYYLRLDTTGEFELFYATSFNRKEDDSVFGIGTYNINNNILTLTFKDILNEQVVVRKIRDSKDLTVQFYTLDNIRGDSVMLSNVKFKNGSEHFFPKSNGKITASKFRQSETITFSSLGYKNLSVTLTEPGEYELIAMLNPDGKERRKSGDEMRLRSMKTKKIEWFEELDDETLIFTTKSCRP